MNTNNDTFKKWLEEGGTICIDQMEQAHGNFKNCLYIMDESELKESYKEYIKEQDFLSLNDYTKIINRASLEFLEIEENEIIKLLDY